MRGPCVAIVHLVLVDSGGDGAAVPQACKTHYSFASFSLRAYLARLSICMWLYPRLCAGISVYVFLCMHLYPYGYRYLGFCLSACVPACFYSLHSFCLPLNRCPFHCVYQAACITFCVCVHILLL